MPPQVGRWLGSKSQPLVLLDTSIWTNTDFKSTRYGYDKYFGGGQEYPAGIYYIIGTGYWTAWWQNAIFARKNEIPPEYKIMSWPPSTHESWAWNMWPNEIVYKEISWMVAAITIHAGYESFRFQPSEAIFDWENSTFAAAFETSVSAPISMYLYDKSALDNVGNATYELYSGSGDYPIQ